MNACSLGVTGGVVWFFVSFPGCLLPFRRWWLDGLHSPSLWQVDGWTWTPDSDPKEWALKERRNARYRVFAQAIAINLCAVLRLLVWNEFTEFYFILVQNHFSQCLLRFAPTLGVFMHSLSLRSLFIDTAKHIKYNLSEYLDVLLALAWVFLLSQSTDTLNMVIDDSKLLKL